MTHEVGYAIKEKNQNQKYINIDSKVVTYINMYMNTHAHTNS